MKPLTFKEELNNCAKAITKTAIVDEEIKIYNKFFIYVNKHFAEDNDEKFKNIKDASKLFVKIATQYASIIKSKKDNDKFYLQIYDMGHLFFDKAFYKIAYALFKIVKDASCQDIKLKCSFELSKLYEEAGDIAQSLAELEYIFDDTNISKHEQAKAYREYVKVRLNNLFFDENTAKFEQDVEKAVLTVLDDCEKQIKKAIANSTDYENAYIYGLIYEKRALYKTSDSKNDIELHKKEAIKCFERAQSDATSDMEKAKCCLALGKAYENINNANSAKTAYKEAQAIYCKKKYPVFKSIADDLISQLDGATGASSFGKPIDDMMGSAEMNDLEKKYYKNKSYRKNFQREKHRLGDTCTAPKLGDTCTAPKLYVLKRWNSFTPILSSDTFPSKGGGYFITTGDKGVVFDPGFNFIQNFRHAGFSFNDIDDIFVTHAHNDHTADLESILSLLHSYNEDIKGHRFSEKENCIYRKLMKKFPKEQSAVLANKVEEAFKNSPRRKLLNIYVSPGAKEKCGFLKLGSRQDYKITVLNTQQVDLTSLAGGVKIDYGDEKKHINIFPILAKHDDLMTDNACFGYVVRFLPENITICYTGDTGFSEELEKEYGKITVRKLNNNKGLILLAHIGGFKPEERYYYRTNESKAFYKTHLGRLGLCKLMECLNPDISLISEFGEEFENCREAFADILRNHYTKKPIFPVDIGFVMSIGFDHTNNKANLQIEVDDKGKKIFTEASNVACAEKKVGTEYELKYYYKPKPVSTP
jgi:ribonuclease BN (tRNA processing enzyme)